MRAILNALIILGVVLPLTAFSQPQYYYSNGEYYSSSQPKKTSSQKSKKQYSGKTSSSGGSMPAQITSYGEKVIIVNPSIHAWGAYSASGMLLRSGVATSGSSWCADIQRPCRTKVGHFRIYSLGSAGCRSSKYPRPRGGAPMPYCMFFNGGQAIHGSPAGRVVAANLSHGCVRVHVPDAQWLRFQFVEGPNANNRYRGTKVVIMSY